MLSIFRGFLKNLKFLKFLVGGSRSQGFRKYLSHTFGLNGRDIFQTHLRVCLALVASAGPKRGCLNVGAWNPQESGRKAPLSCNAAFSMLQCSFSFAAAQLLVQMTSALQKSQCCSAVSAAQHSAAQHSENCSATSVFACGRLQGRGLEGWGLGLALVAMCARSHRTASSLWMASTCCSCGHLANLIQWRTCESAATRMISIPENPYPPNLGGDETHTPQIWGVNLQKSLVLQCFLRVTS